MSAGGWDGLLDDELGRRIASDALLEQGVDVREAATPSAWIYALRPPGSRRLALRCEPLLSGLRWVHAARATRSRLGLALLLLLLAGCVPLHVDHDAGPIAQREWSRLSNVAVEWTVWRVIGLPAVSLVSDENGARGTLWLPWGCWGAAGRAAARYEMSKTAHVLAVAQSERWGWLWPLAAIDSALHLPPSEIRSWLAVFAAPPPPEPQGIIAGWVGEGPR